MKLQHMDCIIQYFNDFWADPFVDLLLLKCSIFLIQFAYDRLKSFLRNLGKKVCCLVLLLSPLVEHNHHFILLTFLSWPCLAGDRSRLLRL